MRLVPTLSAVAAIAMLAASFPAQAGDADWKRGRVYYRSVCSSCHASKAGGNINPSSKLKAEWTAYLAADKHAKGKDTVHQYLGKAYRQSIRTTNKAADKFIDVSDQQLAEDVKAFLLKGAKDGDAPATCS